MEIDELTEVKNHRFENARWFRSLNADLVIKMDPRGNPIEFEIDYRKLGQTYSVVWKKFKLNHMTIEEGDLDPRRNYSPLVINSTEKINKQMIEQIVFLLKGLDKATFDFVFEKLNQSVQN